MSGHAVEPEPRCQVCGKSYANGERFCSIDGGPVLAPLEGQTIDGRYRVVRQLGKGGMGVVYEGEHVALGKPIAIKFLSASLRDADAEARFQREAKIASRIVHEHVVQIFDVGTHDGRAYLVMELVAGRDVRQALNQDGPFAPARAVRIATQMLRGLAAIHHAGILHRDIKPANVLLTERDGDPDFVKIMDFGISKSIDGAATTSAGTLTDTGKVIGTPQYMAPEQLVGAPTDHRADVYAVGLTLYAMLAGEAPFSSTSFTKVAAMHVSVEAPPVDTFRPGLPRPLVQAVAKALAKSPDGRFADAAQMADVLESIELPDDVPPIAETSHGAATVRERPAARSDEPTVKASPGARRRILIPALAISGSILLAAILIVRALREDDAPAPPAPAPAPAPAPVVAAAIDASIIDAPTSAMHLAYALQAEREGRLEAAIGAYEAVYDLEKGPGVLWHIAELQERSGDRAKAAATLRRFVAVSPMGEERAAAEKRIAWLDPPAADAGVAPRPRVEPPPAAKPASGQYCACRSPGSRAAMCPRVTRSKCSCQSDSLGPRADLCAKPFVPCDGKNCDDVNPAVRCPTTYLTTARLAPGESCAGYYPTNNERVDGRFDCDACPGVERRAWRGEAEDTCNGFDAETGKRAAGTLAFCMPTPP